MSDILKCEHPRKSFVSSGRGMGNQHHIYICEDCGRIFITATKEGVSFDISFHVHSEEQLEMISKWTHWVNDFDY